MHAAMTSEYLLSLLSILQLSSSSPQHDEVPAQVRSLLLLDSPFSIPTFYETERVLTYVKSLLKTIPTVN